MADPLSFVASIVALGTLAGTVASKGWRYLKAVKNGRDDVRKLIAEVDVLCGILGRLTVSLQGRKPQADRQNNAVSRDVKGKENAVDGETDDDMSSESDDDYEVLTSSETLEVPSFIYECQKTLMEIQSILDKFGRSSAQSPSKSSKPYRFHLSALRRLEAKDLKWPLSKARTSDLIQQLERRKATCTMALAGDGLAGIHSVMMESKLSYGHLVEIQAKQDRILDMHLNQEEERILHWLSPVDPTAKHRAYKRERQPGTGAWLFNLPEMRNWLGSSIDTLWIYGIQGAGKTTLSTLVVDEILARKRSESVGTAYFYIRHDDNDSKKPSSILGSLISQLVRQNSEALTGLMDFYSRRAAILAPPDDYELIERLYNVLQHFRETYIMIDGLDECGSVFNRDRNRVIEIVAGLHSIKEGSVRTLVFSRDELDIRKQLQRTQFHTVSIAATSADLRLFTNAWLGRLEIRSERLKIDIADTLVEKANGMFMWVRAQIDYFQRLPNDAEKRKALAKLPPDLHQTYIRIFETIEANYPLQSIIYIRRLLKWLVFAREERLTLRALSEAICMESDNFWPTCETIPSTDQILRWLGCLVRVESNRISPSHFTVMEFLTLDPGDIESAVARQYLVRPGHKSYIVNVCLRTVMNSQLHIPIINSFEDWEAFVSEHPLYHSVALMLPPILSQFQNFDFEGEGLIRRFLTTPSCPDFERWASDAYIHSLLDDGILWDGEFMDTYGEDVGYSPLHFASNLELITQMKELLDLGADPNGTDTFQEPKMTPLHFAIFASTDASHFYQRFEFNNYLCLTNEMSPFEYSKGSMKMVTMLVEAYADLNRQLEVSVDNSGTVKLYPKADDNVTIITTPLVLALLCGNEEIASCLLRKGADWNATAVITGKPDLCSIKRYVEAIPSHCSRVQRAAQLAESKELLEDLDDWRLLRETDDAKSQSASNSSGSDVSIQDQFMLAFSSKNWQIIRSLLTEDNALDLNCMDERGWTALHYATNYSEVESIWLLLECRADPNIRSRYSGRTALCIASESGNTEIIQLLLDAGADTSAILDDGSSVLQTALRNNHTTAFSSLLPHVVDPFLPDNHGSTALHEACFYGLDPGVELLLTRSTDLERDVNSSSLIHGTPLYAVAREGHNSIIKRLLHYGAAINQVGPGNLLGTALMVACAKGHDKVVELLLSRGASVEVEGSRFKSAEGTARAFRKEAILKILEEHQRRPK